MDKNITTPVEGTFMRVDGVTDNSEVAANTIIGRTRRPFNFGTVDIRVDESGVLTWLALNRTQVDEGEDIATLGELENSKTRELETGNATGPIV